MQIVINIDTADKQYLDKSLKGEGLALLDNAQLIRRILLAVFHGKTLPRNHGQLVDYDEMKKRAGDFGMYAETVVSQLKPQGIVEAESVEK